MQKKIKQGHRPILQYLLAGLTAGITIGVSLSKGLTGGYSLETIIGLAGLLIITCLGLYGYIYRMQKEVLIERNVLFLLFFIYHLLLLAVILLLNVSNYSIYLLPISLVGMLVALLINTHLALALNLFFALVVSYISGFGYDLLIFYTLSGTIASLLIPLTKQRKNITVVAALILVANVLLVLFSDLLGTGTVNGMNLVYGLLNGGFSVILTVGSLPLWEALFEIVTPSKLLELSNSDQKLIQRLLVEAPGTFHHAQLVANLSESAAKDIDANYLLARVGALYHDIGKLKQPGLFKENQNGENPHDELAPKESAKIILDHVKDGVKLANEYKLPKQIIDMIQEHQGTTLVKYFYHKAKESEPLNEVDENDFTYKGPVPQSRESAIVMLADSSEAAIRCLPPSEKDLEHIEATIHRIIKMKFDEGQLVASHLKINELNTIATGFLKVYKGMYHERIAYPKE